MTNDVVIRPIQPTEYAQVGELTRQSYISQGTIAHDDSYVAFLSDVAARLTDPATQVFVATVENQLVGTVTYCPFGSLLTQVCVAGEFEFRMLAVDVRWLRQGIAAKLIAFCDEVGRGQNLNTSVACLAERNDAARNLYVRMGFRPVASRDWWHSPTELLLTYVREIGPKLLTLGARGRTPNSATQYCGRCGEPVAAGTHTECQSALELEPPRYCVHCRRRMVVQVVPTGWTAHCSAHGDVGS